jgi:hypothetical protein
MSKIKTVEAVAVAVIAYTKNRDRIVRDRFVENDITYIPNKTYLFDHATNPVELTTEQLDNAEKLIQHLGHAVTMGELTSKPVNSFARTVHSAINKPMLDTREFGIAVWLPKVVLDIKLRESAQEETYQYISSSKHIGKPKEKIACKFSVIECRWIRKFERWAVSGHDENGNLLSFLTNHESLTAGEFNLTGKVKSHINDSYRNNARVTQLNFVKAA